MSEVTDSILLSIKKLNNVAPEYTAFDDDFIMWINGALSDLNQLGIGPADGFRIEDRTDEWDDFMPEGVIRDRVVTYVGRHVRLSFDPPPTSFGYDSIKAQLDEQAWRLVAAQEDHDSEEIA